MKERNYVASHAKALKHGVKALATLGLYGTLFLLAAVHSQRKSSEREEIKKDSPMPATGKSEEFEPMP
jgi:hypothetical protein